MRFSEFRLLSAAPVPRGKNIWTFEGLLRNPLSSFPVRRPQGQPPSLGWDFAAWLCLCGCPAHPAWLSLAPPGSVEQLTHCAPPRPAPHPPSLRPRLLQVRQVVVKHGKGLLLVSSFPPTEEVLAQLKGLGEVKLILAPNAMHWCVAYLRAARGQALALGCALLVPYRSSPTGRGSMDCGVTCMCMQCRGSLLAGPRPP